MAASSTAAPSPARIVHCKHSGPMSGGIALLIGLSLVAAHFDQIRTTEPPHHHALLYLGGSLVVIGVLLLAFSRIVRVTRTANGFTFQRGWLILRTFPLLWPHTFDQIELHQHLPRFSGYLGAASGISWGVFLVDSKTKNRSEISAFPTETEATRLMTALSVHETA